MPERLKNVIRTIHVRFLAKPLPRKIAIYFHELEPTTWTAFEKCLAYFKSLGYRSASPYEFANDDSERRLLFLSFDDNFSNWHSALPLLSKFKYHATFYVNTLPFRDVCSGLEIEEFFGRVDYNGDDVPLSRPELREIADAGHTIGCHSHSHQPLTSVPRHLWRLEIASSKRQLEDIIGRPVTDFSYPYGMRRFFSPELRDYCVEAGFRTIATGIPGLQVAKQVDPLQIHRTRWRLDTSLHENLADLRVDGRIFEQLTGRSSVGCRLVHLLPSFTPFSCW